MMSIDYGDISFLVFSDDWGEHSSSSQHLFRFLSHEFKVIWVNTIGMRNPRLTVDDFKKAILKLRKMLNQRKTMQPDHAKPNLTICQPRMLPFSRFSLVREFNRLSVLKSVKKTLCRLHLENPILVTTVPNSCDYAGEFNEARIIYYCVDDFSEWPGLEHNLVRKMEKELIRKSDIFVATSDKLYSKLSNYGKPVYLLTHGVDIELFKYEKDEEHMLLKNIPKPRVGYFGLFDERSDQDLLIELAKRLSHVSFVFTGRTEIDVSRLKRLSNVYFSGKIPYDELPFMVKGWDVLILPYVVDKTTEAISPLKLKEYLATGKHVLSSAIPEAINLKAYVKIAKSVGEWEDALRFCLVRSNATMNSLRNDFLAGETWEAKSKKFFKMCIS